MVQTTGGRGAVAPATPDGALAPPDAQTGGATPSGTRKEQFASARDAGGDLNSGGLVAPVSPNSLLAGSVIAASLLTGLNSDQPRSEEHRVGHECVLTCRSRWSPAH